MHTSVRPSYPENAYCAIFGYREYPDIPPDAEETLEYVASTLTSREADMFMHSFRDDMTYVEIGEQYDIKKQRVQQIISKAIRKLRHSSRSEILSVGREEYLKTVLAANEEARNRYYERIYKLEALIKKQTEDVVDSIVSAAGPDKQAQARFAYVLGASIDCLDLSIRPWNCLSRVGIRTVKDIIDYGDLSGIRGMGRISVQEVQDKTEVYLASKGYEYVQLRTSAALRHNGRGAPRLSPPRGTAKPGSCIEPGSYAKPGQ